MIIMAMKMTKNGRTSAYAAPYWRFLAAVRRGRERTAVDASDAAGAEPTVMDIGGSFGRGGRGTTESARPRPRRHSCFSGDRETLVFGVLGAGVLPGLQAGHGVGLVGERLAEGLLEVRVHVIHERHPAEVGADRLGDLRELFVHLLSAVKFELLVEEARVGQDFVQHREQELLVGELEGRLLVRVDEQRQL